MALILVLFHFPFKIPSTFTYYLRRCGCLAWWCDPGSASWGVWPLTSHAFFRSRCYYMSIHGNIVSKEYQQVPKAHLMAIHILSYPIVQKCPTSSHCSVLLTPAMMVFPCLWSLGIKSPKCPWQQMKLAVQWDPCCVPCKNMPDLGTKIFKNPGVI